MDGHGFWLVACLQRRREDGWWGVGLRVVAAAFYNICLCSLQTTDFLLLAAEPRGLGAVGSEQSHERHKGCLSGGK